MSAELKIFAIELTNVCNARCSFCPYPTPQHTRKRGMMSIECLYKIIEQAGEPKRINLSGLGEPTLHEDLVSYVDILKTHDFDIQLNTNGKLLTQKLYDELVEAGLHNIVLTSDYFPWKKGKIKTVEKCPITFFTIMREPDHPEMGQVRKPMDDWAGQIGVSNRPKVDSCSFLADDFVQITWNGIVQRCCCDFNANHAIGSIWDHEFLARYRQERFKNKGIPLCAGCKGYKFQDGIVAGDYEGAGDKAPPAFQSPETYSIKGPNEDV